MNPPAHLRSLFDRPDERRCYYLKAEGADQFFLQLAKALDCFPPAFMRDPARHMLEVLEQFAEFPIDKSTSELDLLNDARNNIKKWQQHVGSKSAPSINQEVSEALATDNIQEAETIAGSKPDEKLNPELASLLAWMQGNDLYERAEKASDLAEQVALFGQAFDKYKAALAIKPDKHEALYNWGNALDRLAQRSEGEAAKALWEQAIDKYKAALAIKPDKHEALYNWGNALNQLAQRSEGEPVPKVWTPKTTEAGLFAQRVRS